MSEIFDVCVVGAGMAGRLMALALDDAGLKVALVDRKAPEAPVTDGRTTALAFASVRMIKRLGLWDQLAPKAEPITDILVSNGAPRDRFRAGGLTGGQLHFPATLLGEGPKPQDEPALGYIVENRDLLAVCQEKADTTTIEGRFGSAVASYETATSSGEGVLKLDSGEEIRTRLVVACDGKFSPLRALKKLQTLNWGYD
ncbi:MAG: FAD-dependent oxidoreductase, partial [Pseudomonadota bacterium]